MARIVAMPGPTPASAGPRGRARTLAQVYRHFAGVDAAQPSPLSQRVAVALSASEEALGAIETAPAHKRHPRVILAALHDLASPAAPRRWPRPMPLWMVRLPLPRRSTRWWQ
jgi:Uncharacterized protein conserved in bacteria (DUF2332)